MIMQGIKKLKLGMLVYKETLKKRFMIIDSYFQKSDLPSNHIQVDVCHPKLQL